MGMDNSVENPSAVRTISMHISEWINRLGPVWIDGQVAQISRRPGMRTAWITLRDVDVDMSLSIVAAVALLDRLPAELEVGQRIVVHAKAEVYTNRGTLQLRAREIRTVGRGALLEELLRLQALLAAEGLFAPERKRPLPFIPRRVGLICGRASAAMHDVLVNAEKRWPGVKFNTQEVAVQGVSAVTDVVDALTRLNADPMVDVIIIARGGGSFEDLLPFSNERLLRAAATSRAPIISAIGHENDEPLLDFVADFRASTPTDAAKNVVPNLTEEIAIIDRLRIAARQALMHSYRREEQRIADLRWQSERRITALLNSAARELQGLIAHTRALSPQSTLDRGYAVVQLLPGPGPTRHTKPAPVVRSIDQVPDGARVRIRVADGTFTATRTGDDA